jgi:organic radical activating enzyme
MSVERIVEFEGVDRSDTLDITIRLSDRCNFTCNYCSYYDNTEKFFSKQHMIRLFESILDEVPDRDIMFYLHGGEPTIVPKLQDILVHVLTKYNKQKISFEIQTNTSQHIKWFKKLIPYNECIKFVCSYQHHQNKSFQTWLDKVLFLEDNNMLHCIDFMLEHEHEDEVIDCLQSILDSHSNIIKYISLHYINYTINDKYTGISTHFNKPTDIYKITYNNGKVDLVEKNKIHSNNLDEFKFFKCEAGRKNLVVDVNGDVWYCLGHKGFGRAINKTKPQFNIFKNNMIQSITSKDCICLWSKCYCELWLKKWRV